MKVIPSHKGSGTTQIRITGKAAHSSTPELGVNAIYMAEKFIRETRILQTELNNKQDPLLGPTTIQCTKINGGFKSNIIPDQVILNYSNRLIPRHKDPKTSRLWFENIIEGLSANDENFHAEIIRHSAKQPLEVSMKEKIVEILVDIVNADPEGAPYYTEAVDYTKAGIPTVICGPGSIDQAHTPDEYISLQQLNDGVRVFKEAIKRVCL